jgi:hypothetical protein
MAVTNLEERIASLEEEMREIKALLKTLGNTQQPWWERCAGVSKDDPLFDAIIEAGQTYRQSLVSNTPECLS